MPQKLYTHNNALQYYHYSLNLEEKNHKIVGVCIYMFYVLGNLHINNKNKINIKILEFVLKQAI